MLTSHPKLLIVFRHYREDLYAIRSRDPHKKRPVWYSNLLCMKSIVNSLLIFPKNKEIKLILWYDGTEQDFESDSLIAYLRRNINYLDVSYCRKEYNGNNKLAFSELLDFAITQNEFDYFYLIENDYIHRPDAIKCIFEIMNTHKDIDYLNLADHLDYYHLPMHKKYPIELRYTENFLIKSSYSTTGSFVARKKALFEDCSLLKENADYDFFSKIIGIKDRKLFTTIPSQAAHCMVQLLPPAISWDGLAHDIDIS